MADRLTPEELAAMRARCEPLPAAPWRRDERYVVGGAEIPGSRPGGEVIVQAQPTKPRWDGYTLPKRIDIANFIAHARTDLPRALDEIDALTAERDAFIVRNQELDRQLGAAGARCSAEIEAHLQTMAEGDAAVAREAAWRTLAERFIEQVLPVLDFAELEIERRGPSAERGMMDAAWRAARWIGDERLRLLADPSPAAKPHMERNAALHALAERWSQAKMPPGTSPHTHPNTNGAVETLRKCGAELLRVLDEAPR